MSPNDRNAKAGGLPVESDVVQVVANRSRRPAIALVVWAIVAILAFTSFVALGFWQIERRAWKLDLIARVEQRVHAPAVPAPGPELWPQLSANHDEYRHVQLTGTFQYESETLVQAVTELGAGFWVLTPMQLADGSVVLVNRGFIRPDQRDPIAHSAVEPDSQSAGLITISGLLRLTEPDGAFLRSNDVAANRWYSRDVQAIAAARGLSPLHRVAPYFIDADAMPREFVHSNASPVGGLTVVAFHNNHLIYAITWFVLALMVPGAVFQFVREAQRAQHRQE